MKNFIPALYFVLCCLTIYPTQARKKEKAVLPAETALAMLEPDRMVTPCLSHAAVAPVEEAYQHNIHSQQNRYGIDVSRYQGRINWQEVKTDPNVSYAYLKATEGASLVDNTYYYNLKEARQAGIKVGAYHFFSPTVDPQVQFQNFSSAVRLKEHDLLPIVDVETRGKGSLDSFLKRLSTFIRLVEEHYGIQPIIYTSVNFYRKYLSGEYPGYKYMIARYSDEAPEMPGDIKFVMWQYTANGMTKGIKGPVDQSRIMGHYHLGDIVLRK